MLAWSWSLIQKYEEQAWMQDKQALLQRCMAGEHHLQHQVCSKSLACLTVLYQA